jgi:hypothetical protein
MAYIRLRYKVPAKRGAKVRVFWWLEPEDATIVGSRDALLRVRLDREPRVVLFAHPTWKIEYLDGAS